MPAEIEINEEGALVRTERGIVVSGGERSVDEVLAQMEKVKQLMSAVLTNGEHYGVIPGTDKPTLFQPGAQKLCFMFRFVPSYRVTETKLDGDHREYLVKCRLSHVGTGEHIGEGVGFCSTMESKYRWRKSDRACPECGAETIKRSKFEKDGDKGWYCYGKIGGCGANFESTDTRISEQETGRKENPDIADVYNTVLKMAKKRAYVDATLTATAASDSFTQDLEDMDAPGADGPAAVPNDLRESKPKNTAKFAKKNDGATNKKGFEETIAEPQQKELWRIAGERAKVVQRSSQQIVRDLLGYMGLEATKDIRAADYADAVKIVTEWDPEIQLGAS